VAIGVLCALFAGVFRYVDQHFHAPETFLENNSELASNADVRQRLFEGFRSEIIAFADGKIDANGDPINAESEDEDDTTDELDPITEERILRDQAIEEILLNVFDSDEYDTVFTNALERSQIELIAAAELESEALLRNKGEVFFDVRALYRTIWLDLAANELTGEITQQEPPPNFGVFKVADRDTTMNFLWSFVRNGPGWRGLVTLGAFFSFVGAVLMAERRPSTVIQFGGGIVGLSIVVVVVVYLIRFIVPLLAGGGTDANAVTATYVSTTWPLVRTMIRLLIGGAILAGIGGIAKLIWPDDWVYSSVSDDRGVRSIRRRNGAPAAQPQQQQQPAAAMAPGYGYPPQGYAGYPPQWAGQPYPGQYPPGYGYPVGPYAQPAQPLPQHYTGSGKPTVPVMPVNVNSQELVPPPAPPLDTAPTDLPADAAQVVPKVVATTDGAAPGSTPAPEPKPAKETVVAAAPESDAAPKPKTGDDSAEESDDWAAENDW